MMTRAIVARARAPGTPGRRSRARGSVFLISGSPRPSAPWQRAQICAYMTAGIDRDGRPGVVAGRAARGTARGPSQHEQRNSSAPALPIGLLPPWRRPARTALGPPRWKAAAFSRSPAASACPRRNPCDAAYSRTSCVIFIEQKCGPHIEQKCAPLAAGAGNVSSWNSRAVSGSSDRLNWSCQRNSKRALLSASSRSLRARVALGQVRRVRRDLVGDDAVLDVLPVRQAQVLLGRDVAEHGRAVPADHGRADGRRDVVVARRDVGHQRPERVEGRLVAEPRAACPCSP